MLFSPVLCIRVKVPEVRNYIFIFMISSAVPDILDNSVAPGQMSESVLSGGYGVCQMSSEEYTDFAQPCGPQFRLGSVVCVTAKGFITTQKAWLLRWLPMRQGTPSLLGTRLSGLMEAQFSSRLYSTSELIAMASHLQSTLFQRADLSGAVQA